jgi:hypothetical protein
MIASSGCCDLSIETGEDMGAKTSGSYLHNKGKWRADFLEKMAWFSVIHRMGATELYAGLWHRCLPFLMRLWRPGSRQSSICAYRTGNMTAWVYKRHAVRGNDDINSLGIVIVVAGKLILFASLTIANWLSRWARIGIDFPSFAELSRSAVSSIRADPLLPNQRFVCRAVAQIAMSLCMFWSNHFRAESIIVTDDRCSSWCFLLIYFGNEMPRCNSDDAPLASTAIWNL